jgi:hypothetical protein
MARLILIGLLCIIGAAPLEAQQAAIWHDPGDIAAKDLRWGVGNQERAPKPPFKFVKEDLSGSKPKVRIVDANGVTWNVKLAGTDRGKNEVHPEIAANRIADALGFFAEEDYFIPEGRIEAIVVDLLRANASIGVDGSFRIARFERRPENVQRQPRPWTFDNNPFVGSQELSGLKILLALVNNWDDKPDNVAIDRVTHSDGTTQDRYLVTDWGASFGRMSGPPSWSPAPTRWRVDHYRNQPMVARTREDAIELYYIGQVSLGIIPIEHARWFADLAARLTLEQARAAFETAGATPEAAQAFAARLIEKIGELKSAIQSSSP